MAKKYIDADKLKAEIERRKEEYKEDRYMSDYRGQIAYYKDEIYDDLLHFIDSLQQEQSCDTCTNDKGCVTCKDGELWKGKEQPCEDLKAEMGKYFDGWHDDPEYGQAVLPHTYQCVGVSDCEDIARHFYELGKQSKEGGITMAEEKKTVAEKLHAISTPAEENWLEIADKWEEEDKVLEELIKYFQGLWPGMETAEQCNTDMHFTPPAILRLACHFANWQNEQMGEQARKELAKTDITLADLVAFDEGLKLGRRLERQDMLKDAVEGYVNYYEDGGGKLMAEAQVGCPYHNGDKVKIVIVPIKED